MNELMQFGFEGHQVRIVMRDGEPWWVAKDVCDALGHSNSRVALERLDPDEKGVSTVYTPGGPQEMQVINEQGLYRLIFTSRVEKAERFKRWLAHEVLPQIRRTGTYIAPGAAPSQAQLALVMAQALVEQERRLAAVEERVRGIEARQQEAEQHLQALPGPTGPVAEVSTRALLNRLVRAYSIETGIPHNSLWRQLYREFRDRYHVDLIARSTKNKKPIDVAEEIGHVQTLYDLACHLFKRAAS